MLRVRLSSCEDQHYPASYWARLWGFSPKTFASGSGMNMVQASSGSRISGRRSKRDYTTIMVSPSAAARVYAKRTGKELIH